MAAIFNFSRSAIKSGLSAPPPVAVDTLSRTVRNGEKLPAHQLLKTLNKLGGQFGIGVVDIVEDRMVGLKSRGVYETPGGTLLVTAHRELEALCLERDLMHYKQHIGLKYAEMVYFGLWFTPLREALDAFVESTQKEMTGSVALSLYKGNVSVVSRDRISPVRWTSK